MEELHEKGFCKTKGIVHRWSLEVTWKEETMQTKTNQKAISIIQNDDCIFTCTVNCSCIPLFMRTKHEFLKEMSTILTF